MTGAMYAAVAGLKAHMSKLNVISNNVANANTNGYKATRVTFLESLYTSVRSGSDGTNILGGNNPSQIGYGCSVGTIDLDMSTKNYMPTGRGMDAMINGDGFFMVGDKSGVTDPSALKLTRVGNFDVDPEGYLIDGQGNVVYGFLACSNSGDEKPGLSPFKGEDELNVGTQLVPIRLPLASSGKGDGTNGKVTNVGSAIYPGFGDTHQVTDPDLTAASANPTADGLVTTGKRVRLEGISIDKTGKITGTNAATEEKVVVGFIALGSVDNPNGVTHVDGPYYKAMGGAGDLRIASIGGTVSGKVYFGGGADDAGDDILTGSGTELVPDGLESSGTDIATEFAEMITAQRGYQANTRIITVTDSMLEELVNMKR